MTILVKTISCGWMMSTGGNSMNWKFKSKIYKFGKCFGFNRMLSLGKELIANNVHE